MDESRLIQLLKQGDQIALVKIIDIYAGYLSTIIKNIIMNTEDIEEVLSDVFFLLWKNSVQLREDCTTLKSYLAAIARNQALKKLRTHHPQASILDDDTLLIDGRNPITESEQKQMIEWALASMNELDQEIFVRHYYLMEKTITIAEELKMNESTIRSRLSRGRSNLKQILIQGGNFPDENKNIRNV